MQSRMKGREQKLRVQTHRNEISKALEGTLQFPARI